MNSERTIEFLIKNQVRMDARMEAKFAKVDRRLDRLEPVVAQNNKIVTQLARYGVSLRSDVRRIDKSLAEVSENLPKASERLNETDDQLNGLIDIMDRHLRGNGQQR